MTCGPNCGCPLVAPPVNLNGFGSFVSDLVAISQVAATVDTIAGGHKKSSAPAPAPPPPPPTSILDSFGTKNRILVMAGLGALGVFAVVKMARQ